MAEFERFEGMSRERLAGIIKGIGEVRAALLGDVCIDIYWSADMTRSVLSRETPHFPLPVTQERMSPGAGGNAAANMSALAPKSVRVAGVVGDDWRGDCLRREFVRCGIDASGLVETKGRFTNAYCKPMRRGYTGVEVEDPRLDFESYLPLTHEDELKIAENLENIARDADVLCVSDQFEYGCVTPFIRERLAELSGAGLRIVADSRSRIAEFSGAILKPNEIECARAVGYPGALPTKTDEDIAKVAHAAKTLAKRTASDVCVTVGARGCLVCRGGVCTFVEASPVEPPVDTVGAGDCFLSAFSLALAAGASFPEAGFFGNLAASVSVKKLGTTGTASVREILERYDLLRAKG